MGKLVYAALPYGAVDPARHPISKWLNSDSCTNFGQARVLCHPKFFMQASSVRMFVASADPTFDSSRTRFQASLTKLLDGVLGNASVRQSAATGIYGGTLPSW